MKQSDILAGLQKVLTQSRQRPTVRTVTQQPVDSSLQLLQHLLGQITLLKGDKGDRGMMGPRGPKGEKGDRGPEGERGDPGRDGKDGKDGRDGKDADVSLEGFMEIADKAVKTHEGLHNHDPFLVGSHKVDESQIGKGKVLSFDGERLTYVELPKVKTIKETSRGGGANMSSRFRIRTVTENAEVDIHDQIIHVDASAGDVTLTFYSAVSHDGFHHYVKRVDSSENTVTLVLQGSETIEFELTDQLPNRGSGRECYSDGSNWFLKSSS